MTTTPTPSSSYTGSSNMDMMQSPTSTTVFEVHERGVKRWIKLEVIEPVTITAKDFILWSTSFTTYLLRIETNHYAFSLPLSEVRRRYSEFCWLRSKLAYHHPTKVVPPLPTKRFFPLDKFSNDIIEERRQGLGKFLQRVMRSSVFLSDAALHLFLQSDLSTKEIDARLCDDHPQKPIHPLSAIRPSKRLYMVRTNSYGSDCTGSECAGSECAGFDCAGSERSVSECMSNEEGDDEHSTSSTSELGSGSEGHEEECNRNGNEDEEFDLGFVVSA